jgi:hypothetical protein
MLSFAQDIPKKNNTIEPATQDSLVLNTKNIDGPQLSEKPQDSTLKDSIKPKKGLLEHIVDYKATD